MLGDYFRSFWRGVLHNKVATLINVGGLAIGLAVFFALGFYVDREFSWDAQWEDADRIYRAAGAQESNAGSGMAFITGAPWVMGDILQARHPDAFEAYARVFLTSGTVTVDRAEYPNYARHHVEPAFLDLVQFETVEGSLQDVMGDPRALAISDIAAQQMFGDASPLGRTLSFTATQNFFSAAPVTQPEFVIRAVFRVPAPSIFQISFLALLDPAASPQPAARLDLWQTPPVQAGAVQPNQPPPPPPAQPFQVTHYFKLREAVDAAAIERDLRAFMDENRLMEFGNSRTRFSFQKLRDVHLMPSPFEPADNVQRLLVYAAIGVLVLLISGCNFVMLATLRLVDRMREVGIRKAAGGEVGQLMWQYLLDAFVHIFAAALLAVLFLAFAFPKLATMLELPMELELLSARSLGLCLLMIVLFTLVSSAYPAWVSSQAKPGPLLRNGAGAVVGTGTGLRKLLVCIQFAIVVVLLLASAAVRQQIEFTRNRDPGYSIENVIGLGISNFDVLPRIGAVVAEFRKLPGVEAVSAGGLMPGTLMITPPTPFRAVVDGEVRDAAIQQVSASADYFRVMSVRVLAGREFSDELDAPPLPAAATGAASQAPAGPPPERKIILNQAAARMLGFTPEQAVEQLLEAELNNADRTTRKQPMRVVGVVADTQFASVMLPPDPQVFNYSATNSTVAVKMAPGADRAAVTEAMRAAWDSVIPGSPMLIQDFVARTAFQLRREEFEAGMVTGSTALAIVIALLGLYGLVAATVVKRVKEIGVRKVMGAERKSIVGLFLWQFSQPIVLANVIAWPFGFWAIKEWMTRFPYQLDNAVIVLSGLAASLAALAIAWLTVGVMAARAASVNPVHALRYE